MSARTLADCERENKILKDKLKEVTQATNSQINAMLTVPAKAVAPLLQLPPPQAAQAAQADVSIGGLNAVIAAQLGVLSYDASIEASPILKGGNSTTFKCQQPQTTFECLHADGTNSDCFIHSFLLATCPNFRAAKVAGKDYKRWATNYRTIIVPKIVRAVYAKQDFKAVDGGPSNAAKAQERDRILEDLVTPSRQLSDGLIKCIAYYYSISFVFMGRAGVNGVRLARLIESKTNDAQVGQLDTLAADAEAYMISNNSPVDTGGHYEPVRVQGDSRYLLRADEIKCVLSTYSGQGDYKKGSNRAQRNAHRANMNAAKAKKIPSSGWNARGNITTAYRDGNKDILILEGYLDELQNVVRTYFITHGTTMPKSTQDRIETLIDDIINAELGVLTGQPIIDDLEGRVMRETGKSKAAAARPPTAAPPTAAPPTAAPPTARAPSMFSSWFASTQPQPVAAAPPPPPPPPPTPPQTKVLPPPSAAPSVLSTQNSYFSKLSNALITASGNDPIPEILKTFGDGKKDVSAELAPQLKGYSTYAGFLADKAKSTTKIPPLIFSKLAPIVRRIIETRKGGTRRKRRGRRLTRH